MLNQARGILPFKWWNLLVRLFIPTLKLLSFLSWTLSVWKWRSDLNLGGAIHQGVVCDWRFCTVVALVCNHKTFLALLFLSFYADLHMKLILVGNGDTFLRNLPTLQKVHVWDLSSPIPGSVWCCMSALCTTQRQHNFYFVKVCSKVRSNMLACL